MSGKYDRRNLKKNVIFLFMRQPKKFDKYFKIKLKCYRSEPIRLRKFLRWYYIWCCLSCWIISYFQRNWVQLTVYLFLGEFVLMIKRKREFLIKEKSIFWRSIRINVSEAQLKCLLCFLFVGLQITNLKRRLYEFVIEWCCYIWTIQFTKVLPFKHS